MFDKKEYMKQWRSDNKEKIREQKKRYYLENKEIISERSKKKYIRNREKILEHVKQYRLKNRQRVLEYKKKYSKNNLRKIREYKGQWKAMKRRTDPRHNLNSKIRFAIWHSLKGNKAGRHWEYLVGYTLKDLIERLRKTIPEGYDWNDYLSGKLQIDHRIPISAFNFTKPEHTDFKRCWALSNLRLLPAKENIAKNNKLSKPFQPALRM